MTFGRSLVHHRRWAPVSVAVVAVSLLVGAVVLLPTSSSAARPGAYTAPVPPVHPPTVRVHPVDLSGGTAPVVPPPTELTIPAIGVDTSIVDLGLNPDGSAAVPTTTTEVGWYDLGPRPGMPGPAVILGHVDSYTGPGVFFHLEDLRPGEAIEVRSGSDTETFVVQAVELFSKSMFPTQAVFGPVPENTLRLVTCGGPFDTSIGSYEDNWVVFAAEVG